HSVSRGWIEWTSNERSVWRWQRPFRGIRWRPRIPSSARIGLPSSEKKTRRAMEEHSRESARCAWSRRPRRAPLSSPVAISLATRVRWRWAVAAVSWPVPRAEQLRHSCCYTRRKWSINNHGKRTNCYEKNTPKGFQPFFFR
ncbi:hypothetical protein PRIPAC_71436, partial [Pristionchus pacificus]